MADKKKLTEQPVPTEQPASHGQQPDKPAKVVEINPNEGKNIDERMADLLADHKRMGAR